MSAVRHLRCSTGDGGVWLWGHGHYTASRHFPSYLQHDSKRALKRLMPLHERKPILEPETVKCTTGQPRGASPALISPYGRTRLFPQTCQRSFCVYLRVRLPRQLCKHRCSSGKYDGESLKSTKAQRQVDDTEAACPPPKNFLVNKQDKGWLHFKM